MQASHEQKEPPLSQQKLLFDQAYESAFRRDNISHGYNYWDGRTYMLRGELRWGHVEGTV
jgi:hypothetical protein